MPKSLHSISSLATELERDRRTMADALRNIVPDGELNGRPAFHVMTGVRALFGDRAGARERKAEAEAKLAEMELGRREGNLLPARDVEEAISKLFALIRGRLLAISSKLSARVDPALRQPVFDYANAEIRSAMTELSETKVVVTPREQGAAQ